MIPVARIDSLSSDAWKHTRRIGLGGSDAAVLMGVNPYKDEFCVYVDKVCDELPDDQQRETAYWGTQIEPLVAIEFEKRSKLVVASPEYFFQSDVHPFVVGTLDRFVLDTSINSDRVRQVEDIELVKAGFARRSPDHMNYWPIKGPLEIKTTSAYSKKYWASGPHPYAHAQLQHYLLLTGFPGGWIACLIGGQLYVDYYVPRDEDFIEELLKRESEFWKRVENRDPPTPDMLCQDVPAAIARLARHEGKEPPEIIAKPARAPRAPRAAAPAQPKVEEKEPTGSRAVTIGGVTFYR